MACRARSRGSGREKYLKQLQLWDKRNGHGAQRCPAA